MILHLLFWIFLAGLVHSYLLYPLLLQWLARKQTDTPCEMPARDALPRVSVIIAAHNEEKVLEAKIRSVYNTEYPAELLDCYVGSDASTDNTPAILLQLEKKYSSLKFYIGQKRSGKTGMVNHLHKMARGDIFISTDANVFFDRKTIPELVRCFTDARVGIAGARILNKTARQAEGISLQEKAFIERETRIKYNEGKLWGVMIGAFGGCYAIRRELVPEVPQNYAVEDFFITMSVLKQGRRSVTALNALAYEDVPDDWRVEFRRKSRMSAGNFQNLKHFASCLWPPYKPLGFAFLSHKVLRWLGPFFMLLLLVINPMLLGSHPVYGMSMLAQLMLYLCPLFDYLCRKFNLHIVILRSVTYFLSMNLALLAGFFKYLKGEKTHVWQPTERNIRSI